MKTYERNLKCSLKIYLLLPLRRFNLLLVIKNHLLNDPSDAKNHLYFLNFSQIEF